MKSKELQLALARIDTMQRQINAYRAWDQARTMVIEHLREYHGLTDPYQWAYKNIELLNELRQLKPQRSIDNEHHKLLINQPNDSGK